MNRITVHAVGCAMFCTLFEHAEALAQCCTSGSCAGVLVNQTGYEPNGPKTVRFQRTADFAGDGTFSVKKTSDNSVVFTGTLVRKGGLWDKFYWECDFSSFKTGGTYYINGVVSTDNVNSYKFTISPGIFQTVTGNLAFRYYTAQRCGFYGSGNPIPPACQDADLNGDAFVDPLDLNIYLGCVNGADQVPAAGCTN